MKLPCHLAWTSLLSCTTLLGIGCGGVERAIAQAVVPAPDGTGTVVEVEGNSLEIGGGQRSLDGSNLFHSFQRFNVGAGQIANFLATPEVRNILGRVTGGEASLIEGMLRVSGGNAHLYLMNPAGIVFGPQASLDVPAGFGATTANAIELGEGRWFEAIGANDWATLTGMPAAFRFDTLVPGQIANLGKLAVAPGQDLALVGGNVVTLGTLAAPGGRITVAAVPGQQILRLTPEGSLLSLDLPLGSLNTLAASPLSLPELLAGPLAGQPLPIDPAELPTSAGVVIATGSLDTSGTLGGSVAITGNQISLGGATVDASGSLGGGRVWIGGEQQGQGTLPRARLTSVDAASRLDVSATTAGDGGQVIVWAEEATRFAGTAIARGGPQGGNGGFVEISGRDRLNFAGTVDLMAPAGLPGSILFDPARIRVVAGDGGADDGELADGAIAADDGAADAEFVISRGALEAINGSVTLAATDAIVVETDLNFQAGATETVRFEAGNAFSSTGTLTTQFESNLEIVAPTIELAGELTTIAGNLRLDGQVNLSGNTRLNTGLGLGKIQITGSLDGAHALTLVSDTVTFLEPVGSTVPLESLNASDLSSLTLPSAITVTGTADLARTNLMLTAETSTIQAGNHLWLNDGTIVAQNPEGTAHLNLKTIAGDVALSSITLPGQLQVNAGKDIAFDASRILQVRDSIDLQAQGSIRANQGVNLQSGQSISLQAEGQIVLEETASAPVFLSAAQDLNLVGKTGINIQGALNPSSRLQSVTALTSASESGTVVLNIPVSTLSGSNAIAALGDVYFGDYEGPALKVTAGGSIQGGNIRITGTNPGSTGSDQDSVLLRHRPSVILRAGVIPVADAVNVPITLGGTNFESASLALRPGSIQVGDIDTQSQVTDGGTVILAAVNDIQAGTLKTSSNVGQGGDVLITSQQGNIQIAHGDTSSQFLGSQSGSITITAEMGKIKAGELETFHNNGSGGDVVLKARDAIEINAIHAAGFNSDFGLDGGNIRIETQGTFRALGSDAAGRVALFTNAEATAGLLGSEAGSKITIQHGGSSLVIGSLAQPVQIDPLPASASAIATGLAVTLSTDGLTTSSLRDITLDLGEDLVSEITSDLDPEIATKYPSPIQIESTAIATSPPPAPSPPPSSGEPSDGAGRGATTPPSLPTPEVSPVAVDTTVPSAPAVETPSVPSTQPPTDSLAPSLIDSPVSAPADFAPAAPVVPPPGGVVTPPATMVTPPPAGPIPTISPPTAIINADPPSSTITIAPLQDITIDFTDTRTGDAGGITLPPERTVTEANPTSSLDPEADQRDRPCPIDPDPNQILRIEVALPASMTAPGVIPAECRRDRPTPSEPRSPEPLSPEPLSPEPLSP